MKNKENEKIESSIKIIIKVFVHLFVDLIRDVSFWQWLDLLSCSCALILTACARSGSACVVLFEKPLLALFL